MEWQEREYAERMGEEALARQKAAATTQKRRSMDKCKCSQKTTGKSEIQGPHHRYGCAMYLPEGTTA